jgi:hypothetical protein
MRTAIQPEINAPKKGAVQNQRKPKNAVASKQKQPQNQEKGVPPSLSDALFGAPEQVSTKGLQDTNFDAQQVGQLAADPNAGIPDILNAQFVSLVNIPTATQSGPIPVKEPVVKKTSATTSAVDAPVVAGETKEVKVEGAGKEAAAPVTIAKTPEENENFQALKAQVGQTAEKQRHHESSSKASAKAQAASLSPSNERESLAQAKQVNIMNDQDAEEFSTAAFKVQLQSRIAEMQLPKDEEEADKFEENNNISEVNKNAMGDVSGASKKSSGKIAKATAAKPDTAAEPKRKVAKMPTPKFGKKPSVGGAGKAMPPKRLSAEVEQPLQEQNSTVDNEMAAHGVTDNMLANSNEASFTGALAEKTAAKTQSEAATQQFRTQEEQEQQNVQQQAHQQTTSGIGGMNADRVSGLNKVAGDQKKTVSKDSGERKRIADAINGKYEAAKTRVDGILDQLDTDVAKEFVKGSNAAKKAFESHIEKEMVAYKKERYGDSWYSWKNIRRAKDYFAGLPEEVNEFFVTGREIYISTMDGYIETIANMVTTKLNQAKQEIAKGKQEVQDYVSSLSPSLRKLGKEAATAIEDKFDSLEQTVNDKKDSLIEALAEQYAANVEGIDARIDELKAANEGLISKALGALKGVFDFIIKVKNTLTNLLAKIVEVVVAIIADPIGFLSNMMAGVGQGISNFASNIVKHLQGGLISWLTGAMSGLSITMPENVFSLKGIFSLSSQIMGFTWQAVRRVGTRVIGEPVMKALETGFELVNILRTDGIAGLWEYLKEQFQDIKETIMGAVMDMIQTQVVQAGIKWLLGLLSPVGAFVKAVMAIIDVVKFFIERAAQIADLVNAFMDSVSAIASGKVGAVAASIEKALGRAVPVVIGLLASILGIGGLARKVIKLFKKIQKRVEKALVKLWKKIKKLAKKFLKKIGFGKKKDEDETSDDLNEKRTFKTPTGDEHTLHFEDEGDRDKLMMHSTPRTYEDFIKTIEVNEEDPEKVETKQELLRLVVKMKSIRSNDEHYEEKMSDVFNEIFTLTRKLFQVGQSSIPVFRGTTDGGFGDSMTIEYLSKIPHAGTKGSDTGGLLNPVYSKIDERKSFYVRGHLLSQKLHGPGIWENLTPLSRSANSNHENQIESRLKSEVDQNKVYHYHLQAVYGRTVNSKLLKQIDDSDNSMPEKEILHDIVINEQFVPVRLTAHAVELDPETGEAKGQNVQLETIVNDLKEDDLKNYKLSTAKKPNYPINLNTASVDDLKFVFSENIANQIDIMRDNVETLNNFNLTSIKFVTTQKLNKLVSENKIKF